LPMAQGCSAILDNVILCGKQKLPLKSSVTACQSLSAACGSQ
jgi:hypothetical protein